MADELSERQRLQQGFRDARSRVGGSSSRNSLARERVEIQRDRFERDIANDQFRHQQQLDAAQRAKDEAEFRAKQAEEKQKQDARDFEIAKAKFELDSKMKEQTQKMTLRETEEATRYWQEVGKLDVKDPEFSRKITDIHARNPLAGKDEAIRAYENDLRAEWTRYRKITEDKTAKDQAEKERIAQATALGMKPVSSGPQGVHLKVPDAPASSVKVEKTPEQKAIEKQKTDALTGLMKVRPWLESAGLKANATLDDLNASASGMGWKTKADRGQDEVAQINHALEQFRVASGLSDRTGLEDAYKVALGQIQPTRTPTDTPALAAPAAQVAPVDDYASPEAVREAYRAGKIDRAKTSTILKEKYGYED